MINRFQAEALFVGEVEGTFRVESIVLRSPEPIDRVEVPIRAGVTALYGLKGAGKTRTLEAIAGLLRRGDSSSRSGTGYFRVEPDSVDKMLEQIQAARVAWVAERNRDLFERRGMANSEDVPWRGGPALEEQLGDLLVDRWMATPTMFRTRDDDEELRLRGPNRPNSEWRLAG